MNDHEYTVDVPELYEDDKPMVIGVDKFGGGTVGSEYTGTWFVTLYVDGEYNTSQEMVTGTHKTHAQVAQIFAGFLSAYAEDTADGDRFSLFAEDE